jgi:hypothetical protein
LVHPTKIETKNKNDKMCLVTFILDNILVNNNR